MALRSHNEDVIFSEEKQSSVEVGRLQTRLRELALSLKCGVILRHWEADTGRQDARPVPGHKADLQGGVGGLFNEGEPLPLLGLLSFLSQASPDCMLLESQVIRYHYRGFFCL